MTGKRRTDDPRDRLVLAVLNLLAAERILDGTVTGYASKAELESAIDVAALRLTDAVSRDHPRERPTDWNHAFLRSKITEKS